MLFDRLQTSLTRQIALSIWGMCLVLLLLLSVLGYVALQTLADALLPPLMQRMSEAKAQSHEKIFVQADASVRRLRLELLRRLDTVPPETCAQRFDALFTRASDGLWRLRPEYVDTETAPTLYLHDNDNDNDNKGEGQGLKTSTCQRAVASFELLRDQGPALVPPFFSAYMDFVEDGLMAFSRDVDWGEAADAQTSNAHYPTMRGADPQRNPERRVFWTPVYFDQQAKVWMVSVIAPLDWQGQWAGTLGHDMSIQWLMDAVATRDAHIWQIQPLIMDSAHGLIAHPQWMERIAAAQGHLNIQELQDPVLVQVQRMVAAQRSGAGRTADGSHWVAWAPITGPGWAQVLILPQSVVQRLVLQGLAALCAVGLVLLVLAQWFLRRRLHQLVEQPLAQLTQAADALAQGHQPAPIAMARSDEMGLLAQTFDVMVGQLRQQQALQALHAQTLEVEVQERRAVMVALQQERARLLALLEVMQLGIVLADPEHRLLYSNRLFSQLWSLGEDALLLGQSMDSVLGAAFDALPASPQTMRSLLSMPHGDLAGLVHELILPDGRIYTLSTYPVRDPQGQCLGCLWVFEDVTQERATAQQLIDLAERDALTGLPNRRRFEQELEQFFKQAQRQPAQAALLFFDLDEFKSINDTFGHQAGDKVLIRIAAAVSPQIRAQDIFCRLGGDEFAVFMPQATLQSAQQLAERIVVAIAQAHLTLNGESLRLTSSLGIAHYPEHADSAQELVSRADSAMYQAKHQGKNRWSVYRADRDTSQDMISHLAWNERLERALAQDWFVLHFQGIYRASDGQLAHLEALIRLREEGDATRLVPPGQFIAHAERSGKILALDRWVLRQGIALLAQHPHIPALAVNLSGRSCDDADLPAFIAHELARCQVQPQRLLLELTETAAVSDLGEAARFIDALRRCGCLLCLDDFGTGFASFAYLKHLQVDVLKIDGLFIRKLPQERDNQIFVRSIIDVARSMGKHTVAEFVEDQATLDMLLDFGIDMVQGYYLDKPQADHPALRPPSPQPPPGSASA